MYSRLKGPCSTCHQLFGMYFWVKSIVQAISFNKNYENLFAIIGATRDEKLHVIIPSQIRRSLRDESCTLSPGDGGRSWHFLCGLRSQAGEFSLFHRNLERVISGLLQQNIQALVSGKCMLRLVGHF